MAVQTHFSPLFCDVTISHTEKSDEGAQVAQIHTLEAEIQRLSHQQQTFERSMTQETKKAIRSAMLKKADVSHKPPAVPHRKQPASKPSRSRQQQTVAARAWAAKYKAADVEEKVLADELKSKTAGE